MSCGCRPRTPRSSCVTPTCAPACPAPATNCPQVCAALVVTNAWNVPACDATAVLKVPGLDSVLIGSYITNPTYGTFKVVGFNSVSHTITIFNPCFPDNAEPGTVVPAGTEFVFGPAPTLTEWTTWEPVITASAGLTVTDYEIIKAEYMTIDTTCWFNLAFTFETTGTVADNIYASTPPFVPFNDDGTGIFNGLALAGNGDSTPFTYGSFWRPLINSQFLFSNVATQWVDGVSGSISVTGFYRIDNS